MLERVIRDVLLALGEEHAIDLTLGPAADELDVLIDLRQAAADRGDGPLDRGIAADDRFLMSEVPDAMTPVLQGNEAQPGLWAENHLRRAAVEAAIRL